MDPIAHTLVGAALAQTGLGGTSRYATAALVIGANLPDIDGVAMFLDGDAALYWRRGWTHGLPAMVVLPFLLTGILVVWNQICRTADARGPIRARVLLGSSCLAVWSHPSLDWLNTYGMRWLMPLSDRWFYGDTLFVVDPWFWLLLGGAVFLFRSRRLPSVVAWAAFAFFAGFLLFHVVPGLPWAKALWVASVAGIIVLRIRGVGVEEISARRWASGALVALVLYIGVMHAAARDARHVIRETLTERGIQVERLMVGPVPVTPFVRDVFVETPGGYRYGEARLFPSVELALSPETLPRLAVTPEVRAATASPSVRGFMSWVRFPFAEVEKTFHGSTVHLMDGRYTRSRASGFGTARVEIRQ